MDKENSISPQVLGDKVKIKPPKSDEESSSPSSSLSSADFVQSIDDKHFSPLTWEHKRSRPGAGEFSKSETDSNRVNHESLKYQNESFGSPNHHMSRRKESDRNKIRNGIIKRNSRFSEKPRMGSRASRASDFEGKDNKEGKEEKPRRLSIQDDIELEPLPTMKHDLSPNSKKGFFKKRMAMMLTPAQLDMINDKVSKNSKLVKRQRSFSVTLEKPKVGRSKLLQRISNIAARGSVSSIVGSEANPALIFKQLLKKVNPESLHKAEKDLQRKYLRKLITCIQALIKFPFQILTPEEFFTIFWNFFVLFLVIYDSFVKPFEVCFLLDDRLNPYMRISSIICAVLFTLDIVLNFRTAFYDKGVLVTRSSAIIKEYLRTNFIWDFVAICSDYISYSYIENGTWHLKLFSIIRFKKLMDLITRTEDFLNLTRVMQASLKLLKLWGTIILVAHWFACFFHVIAYMQLDSDVTWLREKGFAEASIVERYVAAIYWSILTMVTVGYGDIAPVSLYERMYAIFAMIIASVVFGYSMNTVADIINEMSYEKDQRREKISNVKHYMSQKNLGKNIQTRVKNYIQYIIDSRALYRPDEEEFMTLLSQTLKDEIVSEVNGKILAGSKMFSVNFSHKAALNLAKFMNETFLAPEEVLFQEGDRTDCSIYFIAYGKIQLYHKTKKFNVLEKGSQFGEIAFFSGQQRAASAKSLFFSDLYSLPREVAIENLKAVPSDFEMFHYIKDNININQSYSHLEIICFSCNNKGHMARDCDKIHYVPNKQEVIKRYLKNQKQKSIIFKRPSRPRFHATISMPRLAEAAEMMQEDYSDFTVSDEEISQDSLDIILERNLIIIPGAEVNDWKARKVERRNKSVRYSAQALFGEIINANSALARFSYSQSVTRDDQADHRLSTKTATSDFVFFSIDKVENFEVYYPQHNIRTMIMQFEKERIQKMLKSTKGGAKALVWKNFGSLLRDTNNRRGTKSPLFYPSPRIDKKQTLQRKRKTLDKNHHDLSRYKSLNSQMQQAIVRAKSIKKESRFKPSDDYDSSDDDISTPAESQEKGIGMLGDMLDHDRDHSSKKRDSFDEATMSKKEIKEDRKAAKSKMLLEHLGTLSPKTLAKIKSDNSDATSHALPSSVRSVKNIQHEYGAYPSRGTRKSNTRSSKKDTLIQQMLTKNSIDEKITFFDQLEATNDNIEHALLHAIVKEGYKDRISRKQKYGRAYSLERLEDVKKAIHKYKMPKVVKNFMGRMPTTTKTAHFGM